jgi:hypothetical protein
LVTCHSGTARRNGQIVTGVRTGLHSLLIKRRLARTPV